MDSRLTAFRALNQQSKGGEARENITNTLAKE